MSTKTDSDLSTPSSEVETFGKLLGEAISNLPEYKEYEKARDEVKNDSEAQELINDFEKQRQLFIVKRASGEATKDDLEKVSESQEKLNNLPTMIHFLDTQQELLTRFEEANEHISEPLSLNFGDQIGGCGCS
ncbi:MAG: YlbF family regulator [Halobacteriales archaeon]